MSPQCLKGVVLRCRSRLEAELFVAATADRQTPNQDVIEDWTACREKSRSYGRVWQLLLHDRRYTTETEDDKPVREGKLPYTVAPTSLLSIAALSLAIRRLLSAVLDTGDINQGGYFLGL